MIRVTAKLIDVYGKFEFTIRQGGAAEAIIIHDALDTAKALFDMGIEKPIQLVQHARAWGAVDIVDPADRTAET